MQTLSPERKQLLVRNAVVGSSGNLYVYDSELNVTFTKKETNKPTTQRMVRILYNPYLFTDGYVISTEGNTFSSTDYEDWEPVYDFIIRKYNLADCTLNNTELEYRLKLRQDNLRFIVDDGDLNEEDFRKIKYCQLTMQELHGAEVPVPQPGDIIEGAYYGGKYPFENGVIESQPGYNKTFHICAEPMTPWIYASEEKVHISTSGGPFFSLDAEDLELVGKDTRYVCDWGHEGACANGHISFEVTVNRWKVKEGTDY